VPAADRAIAGCAPAPRDRAPPLHISRVPTGGIPRLAQDTEARGGDIAVPDQSSAPPDRVSYAPRRTTFAPHPRSSLRGSFPCAIVAFALTRCNHGFMPGLTVRNLSKETLRWLRARAAHRGRSLNSELLDLIAVARVDDLARERASSPFAHTWLLARKLGVRTVSTSRRSIRADRDRDPRP
jgi:plasmid stability protein